MVIIIIDLIIIIIIIMIINRSSKTHLPRKNMLLPALHSNIKYKYIDL